MTEVEPEFDANERDDWYALWEYRQEVCPDCGNLRAVCSDPDGLDGQGFYPQRRICYATRARLATQRAWDAAHEREKPARETGWLTDSDGWSIWASLYDLTPDDDFDGVLD